MLPGVFVDRTEDMAALEALVDDLRAGSGGAVVVEGSSGMGKTALLGQFGGLAAARGGQPCRVVATRCLPAIGPGLIYAPIADVLTQLGGQATSSWRLRRRLRRSAGVAVQSAPEVLASLVPGLGSVFSVGAKVTRAALETGSIPFDSLQPFQQGVAQQVVDMMVSLSRSGPPVVVVVDDIQDIDPSSLLIVDRLLQTISGERIGVVISHAPGGGGGPVEALIERWESERLVSRRTLGGLPPEAVAELVLRRRPSAPSALPAMLSEATFGHPVFVTLLLEHWTPQNGESAVVPDRLARVVEQRFDGLDADEREFVEVAAVHGMQFLSRTLARAVDMDHTRAMAMARGIAARTGLIVAEQLPAWAGPENSDCYRFQHRALWEVVHNWQTPGQRRARHARIAAALGDGMDTALPLERRLEIARHLREAGSECLGVCADVHLVLARSAATDGLSYAEAEDHCNEALRAARELPQADGGRDRRVAESIELLLALTEVRWRGRHEPSGAPGDVDTLAAEAEAAAERHGEPALIARMTLLRGKTLLATRGVEPALVKLRQAVERARELGDSRALFVAQVEYGRQVGKRNLAESLDVLTEAERMYACEPELGANADPVLQHARNLGEMQLGVAHYDSGHLGDALSRLERCRDRLHDEPLRAELPIALNYLAQVHLGLGQLGRARSALEEARAFEARRGGDSGWHAYNTALLALALADDRERRGEVRELIEQAWQETERTWLINLVPIVRNLYAEILLRTAGADPANPDPADLDPADLDPADLDRADRLARATYVETEQTGMVRSTIASLVIRSRVALARGRTDEALHHAQQALGILDRVGDMPALRTEEVLYHAAVAHQRSGARDRAGELLRRARAEVDRKAGHLADPSQRESFRHEPLNRRILDDQALR